VNIRSTIENTHIITLLSKGVLYHNSAVNIPSTIEKPPHYHTLVKRRTIEDTHIITLFSKGVLYHNSVVNIPSTIENIHIITLLSKGVVYPFGINRRYSILFN